MDKIANIYILNFTLVDLHRYKAADSVVCFLEKIKLKKKIEVINCEKFIFIKFY